LSGIFSRRDPGVEFLEKQVVREPDYNMGGAWGMGRTAAAVVAMALLVVVTVATAPAQDVPRQTAQAAPAAGGVLASAQYSHDPDLRCDLLEVRRVSGGALLVRWRLVNTASEPSAAGGFASTTPAKTINYNDSPISAQWGQLYYIDPAENKKYLPLTDSNGERIMEAFAGNVGAGQQRLNWAKFPAPPPTSTKISVSIPYFAPFEDAPVSQ
jgi:hypothetical protein